MKGSFYLIKIGDAQFCSLLLQFNFQQFVWNFQFYFKLILTHRLQVQIKQNIQNCLIKRIMQLDVNSFLSVVIFKFLRNQSFFQNLNISLSLYTESYQTYLQFNLHIFRKGFILPNIYFYFSLGINFQIEGNKNIFNANRIGYGKDSHKLFYCLKFTFSFQTIIQIMTTKSSAFISFVEMVKSKGSISEAIAKAESQYCLKAHKVSQITAQQSIKLYESIYLKFYKGNSQVTNTNWYENELRIFVWALVCYIYVYQRRIEDLGQEDWKFFSTIFDRKDPKLFEYQSQAIYSTSKGKNWQKQQDEYLKKIMQNKSNKTKWNQVSKQLFQLSNKTHFRTAKQCRERWNNHLDPSKIKGYWKAEQCLAMFQYVREHGKKWANVVKILNDTRNEHSIKNKFNSIIKKHKKQYKTQNQNEIYEEVINRIKKTIENKLLYQNADVSFELQQLNQSLNLSEKEDQIPTCHLVTQNFLRILHNFNSSQNPVRNRYKQQQQSCRFIKNLVQQQKYKSNINKIEKAQYSPNFQSSINQEKGMVQQTNSQKNPQHYDEFGFDFLGNFNNYRVPQYTFQNGFTSNGMHYRPQFLYPRDFGNRNRWV